MANSVISDVTIRKATLDDKAAVLSINENVAAGRDYLPTLYDYYIASPTAQMFVLLLRGTIVAFGGVLLVDDGLTGVGRAARVNPVLAGHRLAYYLMNHCAKWATANGIIRQSGTEVQRGIINRESRERGGSIEILYKIILPYIASTDRLQQSIPPEVTPKLDVVTDAILSTYFASENIRSYLFPHERILVNSIPYRLLSNNISLIMDNYSGMTEIYSDVVACSNGCTGLLSVGTVYPVKQPTFAYNIEIYGDDSNRLEQHILRHLNRIIDITYGKISIHVVVDENVSKSTVDEVMLQYGVIKDTMGISPDTEEPIMKRVLYELVHHKSRY